MTQANDAPPSVNLLQFALGGARTRRAASALEREAPRLAGALRRALPFLSRRDVPITLSYCRAEPIDELVAELPRPIHATHLVITPGGGVGVLLFDATAIGLFLDGVLGGDGTRLPELAPAGLSAAQSALMGGLVSGVVRALSDSLGGSLGISLAARPAEIHDGVVASAPITCLMELGVGSTVGRVALMLAKEPLLASGPEVEAAAEGIDPRIVSVLDGVELDLVAVLGTLRLPLGDLSRLAVGDTLRLQASVGGTVSVQAQGSELFRARPTTSSGRIALRIADGHED